jgi:hypothetical protein
MTLSYSPLEGQFDSSLIRPEALAHAWPGMCQGLASDGLGTADGDTP